MPRKSVEDGHQYRVGRTAVPGWKNRSTFKRYSAMQSTVNVEILQRTINEVEERLQAARRVYNRAATEYNTSRQVFPTVLIARLLGFKAHELFELTDQRKRDQHNLEGFLES